MLSGSACTANLPMPHKNRGFRFGAYPCLHDLLGSSPSCLQNVFVPAPAPFPSPPSAKSSELPLLPPSPVFPEVQVLVVCGLAILAGRVVNRQSNIINQTWSLGHSKFLACYTIKAFWTFGQTAATASVHRSRSQGCLIAKPTPKTYIQWSPKLQRENQTCQGL